MELSVFEHVADALQGLIGPEFGAWGCRAHRRGIKVWFGDEKSREHYEAQVIARRHIDGRDGHAIEVGFHSEHNDVGLNDAVVDELLGREKSWRKALGKEAVAGEFFGRPDDWRRVSEAWFDADLDDPDIVMSLACRLTDYIEAFEPVRQAHQPTRR